MSDTAVRADGIGKRYRIGRLVSSNATFRDALVRAAKLRFLHSRWNSASNDEHVWALKDVSLEIKQGEAVGIIGHNGAGKSTLLKLLSRITEPTKGCADVYGRIGSLLEVGTGFHQELTGRENVFLSGAILGMKKSDIKRRFDEIVAFSGVGKFIDTPVKHYSTGMFLRLAFAVAAHLEPEILLVDEVLAVGDLEFQKRCLNKMNDVATEGRTVLFVSHNMGSIKELCNTAYVLKKGTVDYYGDVSQAIQHYSKNVLEIRTEHDAEPSSFGWMGLHLADCNGTACVRNTEAFEIRATLRLPRELTHVGIHCFIEDSEGTQVVHNRDISYNALGKGPHEVSAQVPPLYLKPGVYTLYLKLVGESNNSFMQRYFTERLLIDVTDNTRIFTGKVRATILPPVKWSIRRVQRTKG